jgi:hypothetical protein
MMGKKVSIGLEDFLKKDGVNAAQSVGLFIIHQRFDHLCFCVSFRPLVFNQFLLVPA